MTLRSDFSPIGAHTEGERSLRLGNDEQLWLTNEIQLAGDAIRTVPDLTPDQIDVELSGIRIKQPVTTAALGRATMVLSHSETSAGQIGASIGIRFGRGPISRQFDLEPGMNVWSEFFPGKADANRHFSNSNLISFLSPLVPKESIFEPLLDKTDIKGIEIAHLLSDHLKKSASHRERKVRVSDEDYVIGYDFLSRRETALTIKQSNQRQTSTLSVGAVYDLGLARVAKEYSYEVISTLPTGSVKSDTGKVSFSSDDGISRNRLKAFAAADQNRNDPLKSLHSGIADLRRHYGVSKR